MELLRLGSHFHKFRHQRPILRRRLEVLVTGDIVPADQGHHLFVGVAGDEALHAWGLGGGLFEIMKCV